MKRLSLVFLTSLLLFTANASAQSRRPAFKFELTAVDAKTHRPRSTFALGEPVVIRISLTNVGCVARTIAQLPDTTLQLKLHSMIAFENPKVEESYIGGTGWARAYDNMTNVRLRVVDDSNEAAETTIIVTITDRFASKVRTRSGMK